MTPAEYFTDCNVDVYTRDEVDEMIRAANSAMIRIFKDMIIALADDKAQINAFHLMQMLNDI